MVDTCSICLEDILFGDHTTLCQHIFHLSCLTTWLKINPTCPMCRIPCSLRTKEHYVVVPARVNSSYNKFDRLFRWHLTIGENSISLSSWRGTRETIPVRRIHRVEANNNIVTIYRIHNNNASKITPLILRCSESNELCGSLGMFFLKCQARQTLNIL